uniref:Uncharacterized protein n=1 Tax=Rhizophora mucronata TaxID=61149 RepID=A0A2P2QYU6_RHIMU
MCNQPKFHLIEKSSRDLQLPTRVVYSRIEIKAYTTL